MSTYAYMCILHLFSPSTTQLDANLKFYTNPVLWSIVSTVAVRVYYAVTNGSNTYLEYRLEHYLLEKKNTQNLKKKTLQIANQREKKNQIQITIILG